MPTNLYYNRDKNRKIVNFFKFLNGESFLQNVAGVFLGGMIGSLLRYFIEVNTNTSMMLWLVNIVGSFVLGYSNGYFLKKGIAAKLFLTTGMLGAFTTFSTFSGHWFSLLKEHMLLGVIYGVTMTLSCFTAAFVGYFLNRGKQIWNG